MKLGTEVLEKTLSSKHEFNKNRPKNSHTLLKGGEEFRDLHPPFLTGIGQIRYGESQLFFPVYYTFLPVWIKPETGYRTHTHIFLLTVTEFREKGA